MKYLFSICLVLLFSCNSATNDTDQKLPNPLKENPEVDAIPSDMEIKKDSVIVPDTAVVDSMRMMDSSKMDHNH